MTRLLKHYGRNCALIEETSISPDLNFSWMHAASTRPARTRQARFFYLENNNWKMWLLLSYKCKLQRKCLFSFYISYSYIWKKNVTKFPFGAIAKKLRQWSDFLWFSYYFFFFGQKEDNSWDIYIVIDGG
jgi:hypothetical protein